MYKCDVLCFIKSTWQCMVIEDGGVVVKPLATALTSVSLIGGQSVTVNLAAIGIYDSYCR